MAYGEKLQLIDMLAAMEMKQRSENESENRAAQAKLLAEQTKSMQEANKLAELKRSMLTPTGMPNAKDSVYSIGYPEYAKRQEKMQLLSQMTGSPLPSHGFRGGGGGYGRGGDDRGQEQPVNPYPDGVRGTGPDSAQAAAALGEIYRPGGQEPTQAPMSIAELLADERGNVAGGQSLIDQRNTMGGTPVASPTWETPVQNTINQENATAQEQWKAEELKNAMKTKPAEAKNRVAGRKNEATAVLNYEKQLLKDKRWLDRENPIPEEIKKEMRPLWRAFAMSAYRKGVAPDIESFFKNFETE